MCRIYRDSERKLVETIKIFFLPLLRSREGRLHLTGLMFDP